MPDVITLYESKRGCGYRKPAVGGVGIYLVGPDTGVPCGRMPFELKSCPTCGGGIKPSRGWNWITPSKLFAVANRELEKACNIAGSVICESCPLGGAIPEGRHGLIWIGEQHYATPSDYLAEVRRMGLSRKIGAVPKGFKLGETIVYLAHRKAIKLGIRVKAGHALSWASFGSATVNYGGVIQEADNVVRLPDGIERAVIVDPEGRTRSVTEDDVAYAPGIFATFKPSGIDLVIADENAVPEKATKLAEKIGDGARIVKVIPKDEQQSLPIVQEASP